MLEGKKIELSGLKDVPKPFLIGEGRFFQRSGEEWVRLSKEDATALVAKAILAQYKEIDSEKVPFSADLEDCVQTLFKNSDPATRDPDEPSIFSAPRPCDVLFLPIEYNSEDNMPYEHQSGNKHLLFLASQHIAADTNDSNKRVEAAFKLVTSKVEVNVGTELLQKTPRYVAQELRDKHNAWRELTKEELAEVSISWPRPLNTILQHCDKTYLLPSSLLAFSPSRFTLKNKFMGWDSLSLPRLLIHLRTRQNQELFPSKHRPSMMSSLVAVV